MKELAPWKIEVDKYGNVIHGETRVQLDTFNCNQRECLLGNLIADSMVHSFIDKAGHDEWTYASIGLQHRGGIRSSLAVGGMFLLIFYKIVHHYIIHEFEKRN